MLTGLIFGVIAIGWIAYLMPGYLSKRDTHHGFEETVADSFAEICRLFAVVEAGKVSFCRILAPACRLPRPVAQPGIG